MDIAPYIGITDFMTIEQVEKMFCVFRNHRPPGSKRQLHVGVMMSRKTLRGYGSKWAAVWPPKEKIADIFGLEDVYNCLHYADYEYDHHPCENLLKAISCGGIGLDAIQLDMIWPEPADIAGAIHLSRRHPEVILQIGGYSLIAVGNSPTTLVERLADYDGVVDRVLFDQSMGHGRGMEAKELLPFIRAVHLHFPKLGLVVAGGLGPGTVGLVQPIVKEFPDVSIDAQGRLRPSGNSLDPINWEMAGNYIIEALRLLG